MAAKSKKRLSKIENKLLKLEKLELKDVVCSICHSILVEPVTLPCYHDFCLRCFNGSVENNALCCPLCRLRIGSWLRTATKQKNLVNVKLWNFIKCKFSLEIDAKINGEDLHLPEDHPKPRISAPGEIRSEYESELKRLKMERLQLEHKHLKETELLIKTIQEEENEAHRRYMEALKNDEILAEQIQNGHQKCEEPITISRKQSLRGTTTKPRLKATRIDGFLSKAQATAVENSPLLTDDNTSTDESTPKIPSTVPNNKMSPELVPSYGKFLKSFLDKRIKNGPGVWNKENGESIKEKKGEPEKNISKDNDNHDKVKTKPTMQSLLVSLPLPHPGILQHKVNALENRNLETGSVDSMRQELCYFKPIEGTTPTSFSCGKSSPLRVPVLRIENETKSISQEITPSRAQYLESLCRLRDLSLARNLPSAFVLVLKALKAKVNHNTCQPNTRQSVKKTLSANKSIVPTLPVKRNASNKNKQNVQMDGITKLNQGTKLKRTRSMGSISKNENETTPKKSKIVNRKVVSERRPYLRSDSKKYNTKKESNSASPIPETINNNKINLAVKNLSSPLKNCDLKNILSEQLRIEKMIEQEKKDLELARKMDAEWNGRRQPRRTAVKRQVTINAALRPTKKLKV